jgi:signal transduction histidine kinase
MPIMKNREKIIGLCFWAGLLLGLAEVRPACALPVTLSAVETSAADVPTHPLAAAVDGVFSPANGWSITQGQFQEQFAIFAPDKPLTATFCQLQFSFLSQITNAHFSEFEVDVTSDEQPAIKGRWTPLIPDQWTANCLDGVGVYGPTVRIQTHCPVTTVTLHSRLPFSGVTGIRLRLFTVARDSTRPAAVGCAGDGTFVLTEFRVEIDPQRTSNIALGRQAYCSCWVSVSSPARNLTDGYFSTYSQPLPSMTDTNTFFELDLGRLVALDHIVIRGREGGTEADRLSTYRVQLLTESGGFAGQTQWQGIIHSDGSRLTAGGADIIRSQAGTGEFIGRRIRVYNQSGLTNQPQISEIEVYPVLRLSAQDWLADGRPLSQANEITVPARTRELIFSITCTNNAFLPNTLGYRWRLAGLDDQWHETDTGGRVTMSPPSPGRFKLELQARHSDGEWAEAGQFIPFSVAAPWWQNPRSVALAMSAGMLLVAALWWRLYALRVNRRLSLAQRNVELQQERLRIARDMHDDIGARLTYIALLADRTRRVKDTSGEARDEQLQGLAENARSAVGALDGIVWAVNPEHDTVGDLVDYLCEYAGSYLKPAGIECRFDFQITEPNRPLTLAIRHELLMAVKEALQNIVKHAQASAVLLACRDAGGRLEIFVEDDGCGFEKVEPSLDQSGLNNMRHRLGELGGQCEITAGDRACGTRVSFSVALSRHADKNQ